MKSFSFSFANAEIFRVHDEERRLSSSSGTDNARAIPAWSHRQKWNLIWIPWKEKHAWILHMMFCKNETKKSLDFAWLEASEMWITLTDSHTERMSESRRLSIRVLIEKWRNGDAVRYDVYTFTVFLFVFFGTNLLFGYGEPFAKYISSVGGFCERESGREQNIRMLAICLAMALSIKKFIQRERQRMHFNATPDTHCIICECSAKRKKIIITQTQLIHTHSFTRSLARPLISTKTTSYPFIWLIASLRVVEMRFEYFHPFLAASSNRQQTVAVSRD